jgi:uncharacterized membrane protein
MSSEGFKGPRPADYESTPLSRAEYIAAVVHLYRGELYRANAWRIRLDTTTNWSVFTVAGLLTFSFGEGAHSHWILLVGSLLISVFWALESRRYRFADVWRARVRKIEENFYGPILRRDPVSPLEHWGDLVAEDLYQPSFKMSRLQALRSRFVRNYWAIFAVLFAAWALHVLRNPAPAENWLDVRRHLSEGLIPWWVPLAYVGVFFTFLGMLVVCVPKPAHGQDDWPMVSRENLVHRDMDL